MQSPASDKKIINALRNNLVPHGTAGLVRLSIPSTTFFNHRFVATCINRVQTQAHCVRADLHTFTALETLALHVLTTCAGVNAGQVDSGKGVIDELRMALRPRGSQDVVALPYESYFPASFIQALCDELASKILSCHAELDALTALDHLAFQTLYLSSNIKVAGAEQS